MKAKRDEKRSRVLQVKGPIQYMGDYFQETWPIPSGAKAVRIVVRDVGRGIFVVEFVS